jgi:hypothetical protein
MTFVKKKLQAFLISLIIHQMLLSCLGTPYIPWYSFPTPQLLSVIYFVCFLYLFVCLYISLYLFLFLSHSVLVLHSHKFILCCVVILWYLCPLAKSELECEFGRKGIVSRFCSANNLALSVLNFLRKIKLLLFFLYFHGKLYFPLLRRCM